MYQITAKTCTLTVRTLFQHPQSQIDHCDYTFPLFLLHKQWRQMLWAAFQSTFDYPNRRLNKLSNCLISKMFFYFHCAELIVEEEEEENEWVLIKPARQTINVILRVNHQPSKLTNHTTEAATINKLKNDTSRSNLKSIFWNKANCSTQRKKNILLFDFFFRKTKTLDNRQYDHTHTVSKQSVYIMALCVTSSYAGCVRASKRVWSIFCLFRMRYIFRGQAICCIIRPQPINIHQTIENE